ncbi:MAG TPA: hypothetical protein VE978_11780 [Chitinophagales bacterium]|nr:hypothetical protein [Chitinophagales bacterium]
MYENFVVNTQRELYLLLEEDKGIVDVLKFDFLIYKYGYPNDEGLGVHPMIKFGLGFYGFYVVENSTWISEMKKKRPKTSFDLFADYKHYIITFKDVTVDVIGKKYEEVKLTNEQIHELVNLQLNYLSRN